MITMRTLLIAMTITALISTGGGALAAWAITNAALTQTEAVAGSDGSDGSDGADGADGSDGAEGRDGRDGASGAAGLTGQPGRNGTQGLPGLQGPLGLPGVQGFRGEAGAPGPQGEVGPQGEEGPIGPMGLQGLAALSDFAYFAVPVEFFVGSTSGDNLPLTKVSGDLDVTVAFDGSGGTAVTIEPGLYRLSSGLRYRTGDVPVSSGTYRIETRNSVGSVGPPGGPFATEYDNTSRVELTPAAANIWYTVATSTTLNVTAMTIVEANLVANIGTGLTAERGWLLIERIG